MSLNAVLYMKPDCHLCEDALAELERLRARYPHELHLVDITTNRALFERYGERIPVLEVGGRETAAPLGAEVLERAMREAQTRAAGQADASAESGWQAEAEDGQGDTRHGTTPALEHGHGGTSQRGQTRAGEVQALEHGRGVTQALEHGHSGARQRGQTRAGEAQALEHGGGVTQALEQGHGGTGQRGQTRV